MTSKERRRRRPPRLTLNWDLVRLFAIGAAVPLLILGGVLLVRAQRVEHDSQEKLLGELARLYAYNVSERLDRVDAARLPELEPQRWRSLVWGPIRESTLPRATSLWLFDSTGELLYQSSTNEDRSRYLPGRTIEELRIDLERLGRVTAIAVRPAAQESRGTGLELLLAQQPETTTSQAFVRRSLLLLVAALLAMLLYLIPLIRRRLQPLSQLRQHAERFVEGEEDDLEPPPLYAEYQQLYDNLVRLSRSLSQRSESLELIDHVGQQLQRATAAEEIAEALLRGAARVLRSEQVGCVLLPRTAKASSLSCIDGQGRSQVVAVFPQELDRLSRSEDANALRDFEPPVKTGFERHRFWVRSEGKTRAVLWADWRIGSFAVEEGTQLGGSLARQLETALAKLESSSDLARFSSGTIGALARAIDASSSWTRGHSDRVSEMASQFGTFLGLSASQVVALKEGGLVHDIGKIGIDRAIVDKTGRLTAKERSEMERHPQIGYQILEPIPGFEAVLEITLQHHEWWDGSGYPNGLQGEQIDLLARVLGLADVFDALTSERPYRVAFTAAQAADMIHRSSGTQFEPRLVSQFLTFLGLGEVNRRSTQ